MPSKTKKDVVVDRRFLLKLADDIYDTKSRRFMRLCSYTLQNGPDPKSGKPMHCGLGELYYAMTGHQPKQDRISGEDVVKLAIQRSSLHSERDASRQRTIDSLMKVDLPKHLMASVIDQVNSMSDDDFDASVEQFDSALSAIQDRNDAGACGSGYEAYRARACRVAHQLRIAAKLLPV